jgi:membrane protease YdiL (CAAX protease family)
MVSQKPWTLEAAARLFITVIVTLLVGIFFASLVETFKFGWSSEQRDFVEMILATIFFQISVLFWIHRFLRAKFFRIHRFLRAKFFRIAVFLWPPVSSPAKQISLREAFFAGGRTWRAAGLGVGVGVLSAAPLVWLQSSLSDLVEKVLGLHLQAQEVVEKLSSPTVPVSTRVFLGVTAIVLAPLAEEALFRGILYPTVKQIGYPRAALWGASVLFGLSHASLMAFIPLTLFSMLLVYLYEATDNLMAPIMAHCALNAVNFCWILSAGSSASGVH